MCVCVCVCVCEMHTHTHTTHTQKYTYIYIYIYIYECVCEMHTQGPRLKSYRAHKCLEYGWRRASHGTIRTAHTTSAAALKTTIHPQTRSRKPYAATQHLMLLMMDIRTRNMSS